MSNLSLILSEVMDDIGVNEIIVMKRRRAHLLTETIENIPTLVLGGTPTTCIYHMGSHTEGATTDGLNADIDCLYTVESNVIQSMNEYKYGKHSHIMIQNENSSPGYCYLQVIEPYKASPATDNDVTHHSLGTYVCDSGGRLLCKNTWMRISEDIITDPYPNGDQANTALAAFDMIIALYCESLPIQVISWLQKQKENRWPTEAVLEKCRNSGCFVVPVSSRVHSTGTLESNIEWRVYTGLQERYLMFSLNITQLMCLTLVKMILRTYINPLVGDFVSSFMCKNVLWYCIANSSHDWHKENLLSYLHLSLFMLKECVTQRNCPHLMIPENNLLAGKMTDTERGKLLDIIDNLLHNDKQLLFGIHIDDLGRRLTMKLNLIPYSPTIPSATFISEIISTYLVKYVSKGTTYVLHDLLREINHSSPKSAQYYLFQTCSTLERYSKEGDLQNTASELLIPLIRSTLGSVFAITDIDTAGAISDQAYFNLVAGKKSDALAGILKLVSVLYCSGDIEGAEHELAITQAHKNFSEVHTFCDCFPKVFYSAKQGGINTFDYFNEQAIRSNVALCTIFLQCEIKWVPHELRYEILRSYIEEDRHMRTRIDSLWMDWIVIDSIPYHFFLQYKACGYLQRRQNQLCALRDFYYSIEFETGLGHRESALNLLGQCMEQENRQSEAFACYVKSLHHRMRNNAARFLLCMQLWKLSKRDSTQWTLTARLSNSDNRDTKLTYRRLFQLRWMLMHVGTTVLQKRFDDLICDDFDEYLTSNEAEKITLHWMIDTLRISKSQVTLLSRFDSTLLSSNGKKPVKTNQPPSGQTPSSYSVENSEKMVSSAKSEFGIWLKDLVQFVFDPFAPDNEAWENLLNAGISIEAEISRLRKCLTKSSKRLDRTVDIELDKTTTYSNDTNSDPKFLISPGQAPSSYLENMRSSAKYSKFDITLLTVLLRFVCGLRAPNDGVWKKPLPEDLSIEADISRLAECRNNLIKWNSCEDDINDEMIAQQRKNLFEILTRLDTSVEIKDDLDFDEHLDKELKQRLEEWYENGKKDEWEEEYAPIMCFQDSDKDAWTKDEETVLRLLHEGKLPNTIQLSEMCKQFQSNSYIVRKVCGYICNTMQMTSTHIKRCWPAYVYNKKHEANRNLVTFVTVKDTEDKLNIDKIFGDNIQVYEHFNDSHSIESAEMMSHDMTNKSRFNDNLEKCLRKYSLSLMSSHSNITLVAGSTVKSAGYTKTEKGTTLSKPCIVIYVQKKGYIPLGEEPFPTKLDEFDTDVRECVVSLYSNSRAYQKDENILMGTSISRKYLSKAGTLGGFLEHPVHNLCGLTCAHVVLNDGELKRFSGLRHYHPPNGKRVVQPATLEGDDIGEIACTIVKQGDVGIDLALVKIHAREPNSGEFAIAGKCEHTYSSGNTLNWRDIQEGAKVIKFGAETGHTEAVYKFLGPFTFRDEYGIVHPLQQVIDNHHKPSQRDHVVDDRPSQSGRFSAKGDSGAMCFVKNLQGLHAIGVIVGASRDLEQCFLTPIHDILNALNESQRYNISMKTFPERMEQ